MMENWQEEFLPHILARGKKYFEEGRVGKIQRDGDVYLATVNGTEAYEVKLICEQGKVRHAGCSCPYVLAEPRGCKHMAAVLYALEQEDVSIEELPPAELPPVVSHIPTGMPWLDAIDNLPEAVIRKELMKLADRDDRLQERLAVLHLGKLPEHQIQNWKADLWEMARAYADRRGRIPEENAEDFFIDLNDFQDEKLPLLCEVGAVMDAFHVVWIVMETALEWEVEDLYEGLEILMDDCWDHLKRVFVLATEAQREQMLQWYRDNRNEAWPGGVEQLDHIFLTVSMRSESNSNKP